MASTVPLASAETSTPSSTAELDSVGTRERLAYAAGDFASNFYWKLIDYFLLIFYTDVFGLSAAAMGTMLLVTRIFDAVNDPVMGVIADRTDTRWGKFRPYIAALAVPLAIGGVCHFRDSCFLVQLYQAKNSACIAAWCLLLLL